MLLEKLATGGMAEVFLARGTGTAGIGKFFAIKRILPQYADSPEFIEMFKDEAKIAINLNHSNIVSIHEFGVENGQFYLVMDYVEGRNLRQILNKMKKTALQFSADQIVYMIKEVGGGLDHAHRCIDGSTGKPLNITHRDISPQNLMMSFEGEVKIVDFGIAKAESQLETTRAGTLKGKFGYMSPEQAEGQPVDLRTDIFSLGIVMWELLANDRLFFANNEANTLRKIRDCQIPSLRKVNPNIHPEIERVVQKALARDRNLRYQTGAALHRDLNRFLNRQYPDFSAQDFSVFIKSVFADEILSLRKRLVEYSKINLGNTTVASTLPSRPPDHTVIATKTSSQVSMPSEVLSVESIHAQKLQPARAENQENSLVTVATRNTDLSILTTPTSQSDHPLLRSITQENTLEPVLNEKAIAAEMTRSVQVKPKLPEPLPAPSEVESEDFSSPSISWRNRSQPSRSTTRSREPHSDQQATPARFATFMVFLLLCLSVYAYLVKYFTPMMTNVITVTDPVLHSFHVALIGDIHIKDMPSVGLTPPAPTPPPPDPSSNDPLAMLVISNPSGAEILINDKSTGLTTPGRIEIPHGSFNITIRKHGFVDTNMRDVTKEKAGRRLMFNLIKMNIAYLDIDILPPQEARIFVNDVELQQQGKPIRELPVAANTNLRIRATTANGAFYDEATVNIAVDKRKSVQLNPHRPARIPSSQDDR